jgi:hypothetical protein
LPLRDQSIGGLPPPSACHVVSSAHNALPAHPLQDGTQHPERDSDWIVILLVMKLIKHNIRPAMANVDT